jgi:hypothetical protein
MFSDLDDTIRLLLSDPAIPATLNELRNADISFITPDKNFTPPQTTVDLFLYDVKENRDLRNAEPIVTRTSGLFSRRAAPIRVDCSYIVTAWSSQTGALRVTTEHRLLGQALAWLSRFTAIPEPILQGSLANPIYPAPTMVAQMDPNKNAGDFWFALNVPPRPAFYLTVTIALDLNLVVEGPLVTTVLAGYRQDDAASSREELIDIGGTVMDNTGRAVALAWVELKPGGQVTSTNADGRFIFVRVLPADNATLRARAVGLGEQTRALDIPSPTGEYDVRFP